MTDFFQFPLHIREKIVNKLEWKAYYRIQQTCRDMADLIRTNRNLKFDMPGSYFLCSGRNPSECYTSPGSAEENPVIWESLYGARFDNILLTMPFLRKGVEENFLPDLYNTLKKYRITTRYASLYEVPIPDRYYEEFLMIVKPEDVHVHGVDRWKVLLKAKTVRKASITVRLEDVEEVLRNKNFMGRINKLSIETSKNEMNSQFNMAKKILKFFRDSPYSNLGYFGFDGNLDQFANNLLPTPDEIIRQFSDFNPVFLKTDENPDGVASSHVFECKLGIAGCYCKLGVYTNTYSNLPPISSIRLYFKWTGPDQI